MIFLSVLQHTFQHTEWITKTILEIITKKICDQRIQLKSYNKAPKRIYKLYKITCDSYDNIKKETKREYVYLNKSIF